MSNDKENHTTSVSPTTERDFASGAPSNEDVDVIDLLSTSPFLLTILSHTTYRDIQNCLRTSRGMSAFIGRNKRSLPRMDAILTIGCSHRKMDRRPRTTTVEANSVKINVEFEQNGQNKRLDFLLENRIIKMTVENAGFIKKYFDIEDSQEDGDTVMRPITSLADGLGTLFSLFLPRITLSELKLESSPSVFLSEACVSAITKQSKIARARCYLFYSNVPPFPGMARLYTQLGCAKVRLCYLNFRGEIGFPLLEGLDRKIAIKMYSQKVGEDMEAMERVVDLIKEWRTTEKRIRGLTAEYVLYVSCRKLVAAIQSIPHVSVKYFDDDKVTITLRKAQDENIRLRVAYCQRSKYLNIQDNEVNFRKCKCPRQPL